MRRLLIPVAILLAIASLAYGATFTKGPEPPDSWFVIDVNNDGLDDILTGDSIYVNTGGTFTFVKRLDLQLAERIHAAADINGDGFPDLFTYSESAGAPGAT